MGQQEVDDTETEPPDALNLSSSQDDERSSVNDGSISLQSTSVSSVPGTTFREGLSDSDKVKEYVGTTLFKKVKFITDENDLEIHGGKKIFYCAMFLVTFSSQPCCGWCHVFCSIGYRHVTLVCFLLLYFQITFF
jgi:hypothetical protein